MSDKITPCPFCGADDLSDCNSFNIKENTCWNGGMRPDTLLSVDLIHWCEPIKPKTGFRTSIKIHAETKELAFEMWETRCKIKGINNE